MVMGIVHTYAISVPDQEWSAAPAMRSQQILTTGVTYNGTIYTPFDNTTPSELQGVGASYASPYSTKGALYGGNFDDIPEGGIQENMSPIGDPWIMVLFVLIFAGVIVRRQHNNRIILQNENTK